MMLERIKTRLLALPGEPAWKIVERRNEGLEGYFIGAVLDTTRAVDTALYDVSVYVDGEAEGGKGRTRGECAVKIQATADEAEIDAVLARAAATAAGMKNPWFPLVEPGSEAIALPASGFDSRSISEGMELVRSALYRHDGLGGARINSLEIFLKKVRSRVVNSTGLDVAWSSWVGHAEFIVNAGSGREEIELFSLLDFSEPDEARLAGAVRDQLAAAADRLSATATPACEGLPLLLCGELAGQVYGYFHANVSAQAVYEKYGNFAIGDLVGREGGGGDLIALRALPAVKGSPLSAPYDASGFPLWPLSCIEDGKLTRLVASSKHAHYLGIPATGTMQLFELSPGRLSETELRARPYIEAVSFSDFFVEPTTGDFGGELRLAYIHREGRRIPVTGGTVTGSLGENRGEILLSREVEAKTNGLSPRVCLIPRVSVSPAS
jgi:PmbA protein